jgi:hypothetical protein
MTLPSKNAQEFTTDNTPDSTSYVLAMKTI